MIKIDKNIKMPTILSDDRQYGRNAKYPTKTMEVDDSFIYSKNIDRKTKCAAVVYCGVVNKKLAPKKFMWRELKGVLRIWRVS